MNGSDPPIRLLLVEDNPADALLLRGMLRAQGRYEVREVSSLDAAREACAGQDFDAVLLDLSLPDSVGLETIDRLQPAVAAAPIIVLTGLNDEQMALEAVRHGAQDYLLKGRVDGVLVARTIRYAIHRKQSEAALRAANAQLAEADRRKDEFLAMLAHELRNPLAPLSNAVEILKMIGLDNQMLRRSGEMIARQVTHMKRMLDDLLEVSRVTRGKINLQKEHLDLRGILEQAVEVSTHVLNGRLALHYQNPAEPFWLHGDATRLEQVVNNLLGNALKYTDRGTIWVALERERLDGEEWAVLRVRDTGVGIATEMLPRVFEMFAQADQSLERSRGGLGIGLTMVQRLVQLHGGNVVARSEGLGQGSEFIVRLPLTPCAANPAAGAKEAGASAAAPGGAGRALKALIVDDNEDAARSMAEIMELWGYRARTAHDGPAALNLAREFFPDVVLLDIGLPGLNGYEVARLLRDETGMDGIKIVALTGYGQEEARQRSKECGFDAHLVKPIDLDDLQLILGRLRQGVK